MATETWKGLRVAIPIETGGGQVDPRKALDRAGAETIFVSPKDESAHARKWTDWGDEFPAIVVISPVQCEAEHSSDGGDTARGYDNMAHYSWQDVISFHVDTSSRCAAGCRNDVLCSV
jgi:hypothetical protein